MPYTQIIHYCKKCGRQFKSYEDAEKCEKGHYEPLFVGNPLYSDSDRKNQYPMRVTVALQCGEKVIEKKYYRHLSNYGFYGFSQDGKLFPFYSSKPIYNERGSCSDLPLSILVTLDNGSKIRYYRK